MGAFGQRTQACLGLCICGSASSRASWLSWSLFSSICRQGSWKSELASPCAVEGRCAVSRRAYCVL